MKTATPQQSDSRRDSWPPTRVRLAPSIPDEFPDLDDIDEDPLTYFLTPAPALDKAGSDLDMMLDFDAGIEDTSHPREIVRSVSPSSLDGLDRSKPRKSSPGRNDVPDLSDLATPDTEEDEDDDEEYIRFRPRSGLGLPLSMGDFSIDGIKAKLRGSTDWPHTRPGRNSPPTRVGPTTPPVPSRSVAAVAVAAVPPGTSPIATADALLSPSAFPISPGGSQRGRSRTLSSPGILRGGGARGRGAGRSRPQHLWREPSPDVWSIEEETEEALQDDEISSSLTAATRSEGDAGEMDINKDRLDFPAAKPKKKVRFVLPAKEE